MSRRGTFIPGTFKRLVGANLAISSSDVANSALCLLMTASLTLLQDKSLYVGAVAGTAAMFAAFNVLDSFRRGIAETALTPIAREYRAHGQPR